MKKKDLAKVKTKSIDMLRADVAKKRLEVMVEYANMKGGKTNSPKKIRGLKLDIAQFLTIITEKELLENSQTSIEKKSKTK